MQFLQQNTTLFELMYVNNNTLCISVKKTYNSKICSFLQHGFCFPPAKWTYEISINGKFVAHAHYIAFITNFIWPSNIIIINNDYGNGKMEMVPSPLQSGKMAFFLRVRFLLYLLNVICHSKLHRPFLLRQQRYRQFCSSIPNFIASHGIVVCCMKWDGSILNRMLNEELAPLHFAH